jgi:hypothetical protein
MFLDSLLVQASANLHKSISPPSLKEKVTLDYGIVPPPHSKPILMPPLPTDHFKFVPTKDCRELRETLQILSKRGALDTKRHYRNIKISKNVQLGHIGRKSKALHEDLLNDSSIIRRHDLVVKDRLNVLKKKKKK